MKLLVLCVERELLIYYVPMYHTIIFTSIVLLCPSFISILQFLVYIGAIHDWLKKGKMGQYPRPSAGTYILHAHKE